MKHSSRPNLLFVFADQWRYDATGWAGDPNLQRRTPNFDRLAKSSLAFTHAISGSPVSSPARATLLTGQLPLTHGVFLNDVPIRSDAALFGRVFADAGYQTGYIGKWHVDGRGRSSYIPKARRGGFDYWKVLECTHAYLDSIYYDHADPTPKRWHGYDAAAQTRDAQRYIADHASNDQPFALVLSWGPPHNPYHKVPEQYLRMFDPDQIRLRPNVPAEYAEQARKDLAGYYAHVAALDDLIGDLDQTLEATGIADNTIMVIWSDHGDMLWSQGVERKQWPYDESCRVPLLIRWPERFGRQGRAIDTPIDTVDLMPTLLGLCGLEKPDTCQGLDYGPHLVDQAPTPRDEVVMACYHPFGEFSRQKGGREFRGLRTPQHTYVETLHGPWLLFDNHKDPCQMDNLVGDSSYDSLRNELSERLRSRLADRGDQFEPSECYLARWGYNVDERGVIPRSDKP